MSRRRRVPLPVLGASLLLVTGLVGGLGGCVRETERAPTSERVPVLVIERVMPAGKLVAAAAADGTVERSEVPADVAPDDRLTTLADIPCLVAARSLPTGTVLRRSMFVPPGDLGLDAGLTEGSVRPAECP